MNGVQDRDASTCVERLTDRTAVNTSKIPMGVQYSLYQRRRT